VQTAPLSRGLTTEEPIMCYEFSHWFTTLRSAEAAKKLSPQSKQVAAPPAPAPQAQPAAEAKPPKERATVPV
jgi:hypothetical protein